MKTASAVFIRRACALLGSSAFHWKYQGNTPVSPHLQQIMAGSRNFSLKTISRNDLMALTEEASKVSGIPYVMDAYADEALTVLLD